jgi:hypothetical protein
MKTPTTKIHTNSEALIINALKDEARAQYNTTLTAKRRAAEEREESKRELERMGLL